VSRCRAPVARAARQRLLQGRLDVDFLVDRKGEVFEGPVGGNHRSSVGFGSGIFGPGDFKSTGPWRTIASARSLDATGASSTARRFRPTRAEVVLLRGWSGTAFAGPGNACEPSPRRAARAGAWRRRAAPGRGRRQSLRRAARLRRGSSRSLAGALAMAERYMPIWEYVKRAFVSDCKAESKLGRRGHVSGAQPRRRREPGMVT
jgi:hypothetical protein